MDVTKIVDITNTFLAQCCMYVGKSGLRSIIFKINYKIFTEIISIQTLNVTGFAKTVTLAQELKSILYPHMKITLMHYQEIQTIWL